MSKSYINRIMSFKALTLWYIWLSLLKVSLGNVKHTYYKFDIEYMNHKPDCIEHVVMGINGQFPGPTIRAQVGDTLNIEVTNKLTTEGTVIHWHGIRQVFFIVIFSPLIYLSLCMIYIFIEYYD